MTAVDRSHWPDWAKYANAAGRAHSVADRNRPPGLTGYHRLLARTLSPPPRWVVDELVAATADSLARERWPSPRTSS